MSSGTGGRRSPAPLVARLRLQHIGQYSPRVQRLGQALSAAQHGEGHLQVVGVGDWKPTSTRPAWNAEPGLTEEES
jgi:hypothetical protein